MKFRCRVSSSIRLRTDSAVEHHQIRVIEVLTQPISGHARVHLVLINGGHAVLLILRPIFLIANSSILAYRRVYSSRT